MALEDFATEDQYQSEAPQQIVDAADEDLFGFQAGQAAKAAQASGSSGMEANKQAQPTPAESAPPRAALPARQPAQAPAPSSVLAQTSPEPSGKPRLATVKSSSGAARSYPPYDPNLDEDLFHFDELFTPAESKAGHELITKAEATVSASNEQVEPAARPSGNLSNPPQTASTDVASAPSATRSANLDEANSPMGQRTDALQSRSKLGMSVGLPAPFMQLTLAAVLTVQAAFVFFAWQASRTFQDAVQVAQQELIQPQRAGGTSVAPTSEHAAEQSAKLESTPDSSSTNLTSAPSIEDWVSEAKAPWEISIRIAERDIEEGEYASARRLLYSLLAAQDRQGLPQECIAEVHYLIAESWTEQSANSASSGAMEESQ